MTSRWDSAWKQQLDSIEQLGRTRVKRTRARMINGRVNRAASRSVEIELDGRPLLNFGSNDYLDLATHPRLVEAAVAAAYEYGWGSGASPLVTGRGPFQQKLETELAKFEQCEQALLFPSGFAANSGTIAALLSSADVVYSDQLNHASIIDGCRLSGASIQVFRHGDIAHLEELIRSTRSKHRQAMIVSDSLFSMDGDLASLSEIVAVAEKFDCVVMIDEAHATGVYGKRGSGWCEELGLHEQVTIRVGTLSKAVGAMGGFVAGSHLLIDLLLHRARSYMFSTAMPEPNAAAACVALEMICAGERDRTRLREMSRGLRERLREQGHDVPAGDSPIIPIYVGQEVVAVELSQRLQKEGLLVPAIRPPTVPVGRSLLRISLSVAHTEQDLERLTDAVAVTQR